MSELSAGCRSICIMGIGGGGGKMLSALYRKGSSELRYVAVNTDKYALAAAEVKDVLQLGPELLQALGAGADPKKGEKAAQESSANIIQCLEGVSLLILLCGLGGGTGSGATPVIAQLAKQMDITVFVVATRPFFFEGKKRNLVAEKSIKNISAYTDCLVVIDNNCFISPAAACGNKATFLELLQGADRVVGELATALISDAMPENAHTQLFGKDLAKTISEAGTRVLGKEKFRLTVQCACGSDVARDLGAGYFSDLSLGLALLAELYVDQEFPLKSFRICFHFSSLFRPENGITSELKIGDDEGKYRSNEDDFVFDEGDAFSFFPQRHTGGPHDSGIWFRTPLPPKSHALTTLGKRQGKAVILHFPKEA